MTDRQSASPPDDGVMRVLAAVGISRDAFLGVGGEAWVFADGSTRVLRIHHPGVTRESVDRRARLLAELGRSADAVPFAIPSVEEVRVLDDRILTLETRLAGRPLIEILADAAGDSRIALIRGYLEAAGALGNLAVDGKDYGDLTRDDSIRAPMFRGYLEQRAAASLRAAGPDFADVSARELASAWPEPETPAFVHLDAFPGNMLSDGKKITAVIDFGGVSLRGDQRLDPLGAAAYLAPEITPTARPEDRELAKDWLEERGWAELLPPAERWIAAFWSAAVDDVSLHRWCRRILLDAREPRAG